MLTEAALPAAEKTCISLVDDDFALRRYLKQLLRSKDYAVRAYSTAEPLLADTRSRMSACLITDRQMPGMDGFTLLRQLGQRGRNPPAILITASKAPDLASRATEAGFHAVLIKPLLDLKVLEAVRNAVTNSLKAKTETTA